MPPPTRAVLLDALGTLVELEPPFGRLHAALGGDLPAQAVERAMRAEMAYYREHSHEGRDEASLAELQWRCAELLGRELGRQVSVETMMSAIRFRSFPDAPAALADLRARGLRTVCVSNWDCSLAGVLAGVGLGRLVDEVVASALVGARKPEPRIFAVALERAGCAPQEALHVGDTPEEDVDGALAAGIRPLLIARSGDPRREADVPAIASLAEISDHLAA